ncbi:MAG TPA: hypothetical protein VH092_33775, partial [Urbifossiella sp.]|nr:hypothetical protein [Urbifossiella sp.]
SAAHDPAHRPRDAADLADRLARMDAAGAPPPAADPPRIVSCPSCQVSLRFRAGATALRCTRCGMVFNPSVAPAPAPVVEARLSPPPPPLPPPPAETRRPEPVTRRRDDDYGRSQSRRRDDDDDRSRSRRRNEEDDYRRGRDRGPRAGGGIHPAWIVGGVLVAVVSLIVLVFAVRGRGPSGPVDEPRAGPVADPTGPPPSPPGFNPNPVVPVVPVVPPRPPIGGGNVPGFPRITTPPGTPVTGAVGQAPTVGQLRTFVSPGLAKDAEVRYAADGQTLVAAMPDGGVTLVSALDGTQRLTYSSGVKGFRPAVFPDGQTVVTALDGKKGVYVINAATGIPKTPVRLPLFDEVPMAAAASRNKEWIAVGGDGGKVVAWRTDGKGNPFIFFGPGKGGNAFPGPVSAMAFSDHVFPELLAASGTVVREWESFGDWKLKQPRTLTAAGPVFAVLPLPNHRGVVAGISNLGLTAWDIGSTAGPGSAPAEGVLKGFTKAAVGGSSFESHYAAMTGDGKFGFWDTVRINPISPEPNQPPAADLDFHKDGKLLAVGHADGSVGIWHTGERRVNQPKQAVRITDHGGPLVSVAWSPDGKDLATVDKTGRVRIWTELKIDFPVGPPFEMKAP